LFSNKSLSEFQRVGRALLELGLVGSHSGNMSLRHGQSLYITRHGAMLGFLEKKDIVKTGMARGSPGSERASREVNVHRAILTDLRKNGARSVIHAHPIYAIALSLVSDEIVPVDVEGSFYLPRIPVLSFTRASASQEMEDALPRALRKSRAVMVRGHGSFAVGRTLEEALQLTSVLESNAEIMYRVMALGGDIEKLTKRRYLKWPTRK